MKFRSILRLFGLAIAFSLSAVIFGITMKGDQASDLSRKASADSQQRDRVTQITTETGERELDTRLDISNNRGIEPCSPLGACKTPATDQTLPSASVSGALEPASGFLPAGTQSITLRLTTEEPSNCRWSEGKDVPFEFMPNVFQIGQGTLNHKTVVAGFHDLDDRWLFVRCQNTANQRESNPEGWRTHLRVLGPWNSGFPRLAYLWGTQKGMPNIQFFAGYDLFLPYQLDNPLEQTKAIRAINPYAKILLTLNATHGWPDIDPLTTRWWNSQPGDPAYNCLLRDSHGKILLVRYWGHPMFNMVIPYCRAQLVQKNIEDFRSQSTSLLDSFAYDGIFWDLLYGTISWLSDDIDSDLDGQPDDPKTLDSAYQASVEDFLSQIRANLPNAILMGNEASPDYTRWINGRLIEWELSSVLDGNSDVTWDEVIGEYRGWSGRGQEPQITFIQTKPEPIYDEKFPFHYSGKMPAAMQAEAAASFQRMRFGLTSALMGDGLFSFDLRSEDSQVWWYDEFGAPVGSPSSTLPPRGYLGQPVGDPRLLIDSLDTPNEVTNGGFEERLRGWRWWIESESGAAASVSIDRSRSKTGEYAAHIVVSKPARPWSVMVYQPHISTVAGQSYTLSFWARSDKPYTVHAKIVKQAPPGTDYGFNVQADITTEWQHFHLVGYPAFTAEDGVLQFQVGGSAGELWLDDVQFQTGALGVWARPFENGLAVVNTTRDVQTVPLPGTYCKLKGDQAPLFQTRVDEDEALVSAGWKEQKASDDQFGKTVRVASADNRARITYTPNLAYAGLYEVLAWVSPAENQSSAVTVSIYHDQGTSTVSLDETTGGVGWHSLGTYPFKAGKDGYVTLTATGQGMVVADAFKWVSVARYNDGSLVNQVTLQPQDGIVLLNKCKAGN